MTTSFHQRWLLGESGLTVPPIVFGSAALGNVPQVIPEQRKLAICGEWFRQVESPVFVDVAYEYGDGLALEVLGRMLQRLGVVSDEVIIHLSLDSNQVLDDWEKSCQLLGSEYRPKLVSICNVNEGTWRTIGELKAAGMVRGIGIAANDFRALDPLSLQVDWVILTCGFTLMRHQAERLAGMGELAGRQIPIIASGVFDGGFLVGSNRWDGRAVNSDDPANRSLLAWRTSFAALCHGHGVTPAHACIQFALSGPGVVAVEISSSHPDRVAMNVDCVQRKVPDVFWASMKEEGLLSDDYPLGV